MKTKKFFMTFLLAMGMIIAKAANGFPPELVLVSQPVLTYNANSVTIYYDVQNIGDYTYRGDLYIYLDPDDGYYYARKYMKVRPGRIRRFAVTIPAYRPNPSWVYTVMPYYELGNELYSFTTFEYFEPVRFCWYGPHTEPWVVIHVGPRVRYYHRPAPYRYYYDGYYPILPPPPGGYPPGYYDGLHPLNPVHHTYAHHHSHGGYPANHHPEAEVPGYNKPTDATVARPGSSNTPGSMSSRDPNATNNATNNASVNTHNNNNTGATTRPNGNTGTVNRPNSGSSNNATNTGATTRPNNNTGTVNRPNSSGSNNSSSTRPSSGSGTVNRPNNSGNSSNGTRPSGTNNSSSTVNRPSSSSNSGRTGNSSSSSSSGRKNNSSNSSNSNSSGRSGSNSSNSGGRTPSGPSRGR